MTKLTPLLLALALCASCQSSRPQTSQLEEPLLITTEEDYSHSSTETVFPVQVADFNRQRVVQYDEAANDIAVGYEYFTPQGNISVTFYLYPNEIGAQEAMKRATAGLLRANPGSEIHSEGASTLLPEKTGLQITVASPRTSSFGDTTVISEAHVIELDEAWLFRVRASYAPELWEAARAELPMLVHELMCHGHAE